MATEKKALDTILERKALVEEHYRGRNANMSKWLDYYLLKLYPVEDDPNLVKPGTFFDTVEMTAALTCARPPVISAPSRNGVDKRTEEALRAHAQIIEDAAYAIYHTGRMQSIFAAAVKRAAAQGLGWVHGPIWQKPTNRRPWPLFYESLDPTSVYPNPASDAPDNPEWIIRICEITNGEALETYKDLSLSPKSGEDHDAWLATKVELVDYWTWMDDTDVQHAVLVDGEEAVPLEKVEGYDFLPFARIPGVETVSDDEALRHVPIFWAAISPILQTARLLSMRINVIDRISNPVLVMQTDTTSPEQRGDFQILNEPGSVNYLLRDEKLEYLRSPDTTVDIDKLNAEFGRQIARSTYPDAFFGQLEGSNITGIAMNALLNPRFTAIQSRQNGVEEAYERVFANTFALLRSKIGDDGFKVSGRSAKGRKISLELSKADLFDVPKLDVRLSGSLPKDMQAMVSILMPLVQSKIISRRTARDLAEQYLDTPEQSPEREEQQILAEEMEYSPPVLQQLALANAEGLIALQKQKLKAMGLDLPSVPSQTTSPPSQPGPMPPAGPPGMPAGGPPISPASGITSPNAGLMQLPPNPPPEQLRAEMMDQLNLARQGGGPAPQGGM